ncbi:Acetyl xylan esterase (AXE1) [Aquisphaera giovannonii]|uniref:Acetyl xylan esterase (AXE1) n=1 Tax=Aquisphaera giovannonii TaxID=406548 RepID=A0A5B9VZ30_9BACT|nr:acetylxylan esterase [Aquisphaera giovannonii]QEH33666.1 Acetyl xylan esterase (AXE1) [Aquisphaera giovannonii]
MITPAAASLLVLSLLADDHVGGRQEVPARPAMTATAAQLESHLTAQAGLLLRRRRDEVAAATTVEQVEARRERLRAFFLGSLGDLPARTPLEARVIGVRPCPGYRVERIVFQSRPRHHVTANLYLPDGPARVPGVLMPCGHSENGKADETYQRACILMARNGLAVLTYDPIGQGERKQLLDAGGNPAVREGSTTEHTRVGVGAILVGRQAASYRIWDGIRALDYLASRPEVDGTRLGCTGNSGGGTLTSYLMALDDRIAAAAPSCYITSLERLFTTIGPQDAEQNITGQVAAGMDHADYIALRAPKPTLLCTGTRDFFDIQGSWDTFREAKRLYTRLGFAERIDLMESDEPHGFTSPRRVAATRWLRRWLSGRDEAITESPATVLPDSELLCTSTGQVLSELHGVSAFDLNAERARELRPAREAFARDSTPADFRARVRELLGIGRSRPASGPVEEVGRQSGTGYLRRSLVFSPEPGLALGAVEWIPTGEAGKAPVVVLLGDRTDSEPTPGGPLERALKSGRRVVQAQLRGSDSGKATKAASGLDAVVGQDWKAAFLSLHLGRPLLGQRVVDLLGLLESLDGESGVRGRGFEVRADGPSGPVALHAAGLDESRRIVALEVRNSLVSWADVVDRAGGRRQLGNAVPGVLRYYDLPDLAARLSPLPLRIESPMDSVGNPVTQADLESSHAAAVRAYEKTGGLVLEAGKPREASDSPSAKAR